MNAGDRTTVKWSTPSAGAGREVGNASVTNTGDWISIRNRHIGIQLIWTGTPTGVLTFDVSMDATNVAATLAITDFSPAMTNPAGSASTTGGQAEVDFAYIRPVFTSAAGAGTIVGYFTSKE